MAWFKRGIIFFWTHKGTIQEEKICFPSALLSLQNHLCKYGAWVRWQAGFLWYQEDFHLHDNLSSSKQWMLCFWSQHLRCSSRLDWGLPCISAVFLGQPLLTGAVFAKPLLAGDYWFDIFAMTPSSGWCIFKKWSKALTQQLPGLTTTFLITKVQHICRGWGVVEVWLLGMEPRPGLCICQANALSMSYILNPILFFFKKKLRFYILVSYQIFTLKS